MYIAKYIVSPKTPTRVAAPSPRASLGRRTVCGRTEQRRPPGSRRCVKDQQVTHTHRKTTPPTPTHTRTRQEQHLKPPNEHLPQTLNNARRRRDDGACHLPRPGGWDTPSGGRLLCAGANRYKLHTHNTFTYTSTVYIHIQ